MMQAFSGVIILLAMAAWGVFLPAVGLLYVMGWI